MSNPQRPAGPRSPPATPASPDGIVPPPRTYRRTQTPPSAGSAPSSHQVSASFAQTPQQPSAPAASLSAPASAPSSFVRRTSDYVANVANSVPLRRDSSARTHARTASNVSRTVNRMPSHQSLTEAQEDGNVRRGKSLVKYERAPSERRPPVPGQPHAVLSDGPTEFVMAEPSPSFADGLIAVPEMAAPRPLSVQAAHAPYYPGVGQAGQLPPFVTTPTDGPGYAGSVNSIQLLPQPLEPVPMRTASKGVPSQLPPTEKRRPPITFWRVIVMVLTFWAIRPLLSCCGIKERDQQDAWREKVALVVIIILLCTTVGFLTFGFTQTVCGRPSPRIQGSQLKAAGATAIHGRGISTEGYTHPVIQYGAIDLWTWSMGRDIGFLFPPYPEDSVCRRVLGDNYTHWPCTIPGVWPRQAGWVVFRFSRFGSMLLTRYRRKLTDKSRPVTTVPTLAA